MADTAETSTPEEVVVDDAQQALDDAQAKPKGAEPVEITAGELARLRKELGDAKTAVKRREKAEQDAQREASEAKGEWEKLAKQHQADLDEIRAEAAQAKRENLVNRVAARLNYRDPEDASDYRAIRNLDVDADESDIERCLADIAKQRPHLLKPEHTRTGAATSNTPSVNANPMGDKLAIPTDDRLAGAYGAEQSRRRN